MAKSKEAVYREKLHSICVRLRTSQFYLYKKKKYAIVGYKCHYDNNYKGEFELSSGMVITINEKNCDEILDNIVLTIEE